MNPNGNRQLRHQLMSKDTTELVASVEINAEHGEHFAYKFVTKTIFTGK